MKIHNVAELEERLSRPSDAVVSAMDAIDGDVLILGAGGKMGPSLAKLARRAADLAQIPRRIIAVSRFSNPDLQTELLKHGVETIASDLLEPDALNRFPDIANVVFMAARKFGTSGDEHLTWAMNTYLPGLVAERFRDSRIVTFSTGNVYPLRPVSQGGAVEATPVDPVGEYAQSVLGRERMFQYASAQWGTRITVLRLNYAVELRYGVLVDIARAVFERRPISLNMPYVNVIWQGDANSWCLRSFTCCQSPPFILNVTGPETLCVREIAVEFGRRLGVEPTFLPETHNSTALLSNASKANALFGNPSVTPTEMIEWITEWILQGGATLNKPTHFQTRDGKF
jgi:nucleoside-diphosphate-sugar epimerase